MSFLVLCRAVLENHHLFKAFSLMRTPDKNPIAHFNYNQTREFRSIVIDLVLATDFAVHLKLVGQFKTMVTSAPDISNIAAKEDNVLIWKILIKCADLGHCTKPMALHKKWTFRIMEEMYRQVCAFRCGACCVPHVRMCELEGQCACQLEAVLLCLGQCDHFSACVCACGLVGVHLPTGNVVECVCLCHGRETTRRGWAPL